MPLRGGIELLQHRAHQLGRGILPGKALQQLSDRLGILLVAGVVRGTPLQAEDALPRLSLPLELLNEFQIALRLASERRERSFGIRQCG